MSVARKLYENDDWTFTSDETVAKSQTSRKQSKVRDTFPLFSAEQSYSKDEEAVHVCSDSQCFTGMIVALPFSLLAWVGVFAFLYFITRQF